MLLPLVYIVILNWNGWRDTRDCLDSIKDLDYSNFQVVVVDNHSSDRSAERLREEFPEVTVLETDKNLGFAGGNNVGIRYALARGCDFVWLLNNDTLVQPNSLLPLVEVASRTGALTGSAIMRYPATNVVWAAGGHVSRFCALTDHIYGDCPATALPNAPHSVDYLPACSVLVSRHILESVGLIPEGYFLYYEDTAWCEEAKRKGYDTICVPSSRIFHKESQSTGYWSPKMRYFFVRGSVIFTRKYRSGYPLSASWYYFRHHFVNHILRGRFGALRPTFRGFLDGMKSKI